MNPPYSGAGARPHRNSHENAQGCMDRIALFLGAGASVPYGMPTTKKLREELGQNFPRQDLVDGTQFPDAEHILQALDDEIRFANTSAGKHHRRINTPFNDLIKQSEHAKNYLENLVQKSYAWNSSVDSTAVDVLGALFGLVESDNGVVTVFTTNYDGAVEKYCGRAEPAPECIDGFVPCQKNKEFVWSGNFTPSDESARSKVFLYKLHGSMNWQRSVEDGTRVTVRKPDNSTPMSRSDNAYILPTLRIKDEDMREEPFATLRDKFDKIPELFDVCIAIGCSFRDKHIHDKFVEFIKSGKTLIAVGPEAASDFCTALGKAPDSATKNSWEKMQLCSMPYMQGKADGFYAVHKRLEKDSTESVINAIKPILEKSASPNRIGFISEPNT